MSLLGNFLRNREEELIEAKCRFRVMGRKEGLSESLQKLISKVEASTKGFERQLIVCLNYGGRDEIVRAARTFAEKVAAGECRPEDLNEENFSDLMFSAGVPDPELVIRPSGELRLSNFLLWQSAYSEFVYMNVLWPDFKEKDLEEAIAEFHRRNRRFGGV